MSTALLILLLFLGLYQLFELVFLFQEIRHLPSYSPIYRVLTSHRNRYWFRRLGVGYDASRTGIHSCILISLAAILALLADSSFKLWISYQIFILQVTLIALLLDQLFWVGSSMLLYFQALKGHVHYLTTMRVIEKKNREKWDTQLNTLKNKIQQFSISKYTPNFMLRFFAVVLVTVLTYSIIYYSLERVSPGSFTDPTSTPISYLQLLYHSVVVTTSLNTTTEPHSIIARVFSAIQGFINLYLFVLVISFFASVSESQVETERENLLKSINASINNYKDID